MAKKTPSAEPSRRRPGTLLLAGGAGLGLFVLGWALGRCPSEPPAEPARPPSDAGRSEASATSSAPQGVELRLDAGGLKLVPDASLRLKPIKPLDLELLER